MNEGNFNALEEESIPIPIESNCNFNFDTFSNDPADWKSSEELISYFVEKEYIPQNAEFDNAEFINSTVQVIGNKQRFLSKSMFKRKMINGEAVDRTWLIFSVDVGENNLQTPEDQNVVLWCLQIIFSYIN